MLFLWVHKGRSSVGVSPVFLIRMISAFVGVAEVLAARRRTANRCVTRLCTSENLLSQGRQLWIVFCSLLIVAFITDALVRFTFYLWTRSAAGRDRSASYGRANRSPAHGKVLSSFLILANCVEFCTASISLLSYSHNSGSTLSLIHPSLHFKERCGGATRVSIVRVQIGRAHV